jgi:CHAD domain-containing protein
MAAKVNPAARGGPDSVAAVRDLLLVHIDAVIRRLELRRAMTDTDVHEARKSIKRARAVLKLLQPSLAANGFARSKAALRDAGRALAAARDAKVIADRLDEMLRRSGIARSAVSGLADRLPAVAASSTRLRDADAALAGLVLARKRLARASLPASNWSPLGTGLRSIYKAGRQLMPGKTEPVSVKAMHEWRKQVKSYWHALEVFEPVRPAQIRRALALARRLADTLGEDHDLALLANKLRAFAAAADRGEQVLKLLDATERRQRRLRRRAVKIGSALYAEAPAVMEQRLRRYWQQWRTSRGASVTSPERSASTTRRSAY